MSGPSAFVCEALKATLGPPGRMISETKSGYEDRHPDHVPIFNANVVLSPTTKVWHGDLDLTDDEPLLIALARRTGTIVYILYERDGRFAHKNQPKVSQVVFSATPSGHTRFSPDWIERARDGSLRRRLQPTTARGRPRGRPGATSSVHAGRQAEALRPHVGKWVALASPTEVLIAGDTPQDVLAWLEEHGRRAAGGMFRVPTNEELDQLR